MEVRASQGYRPHKDCWYAIDKTTQEPIATDLTYKGLLEKLKGADNFMVMKWCVGHEKSYFAYIARKVLRRLERLI